MNRSEFGRGLRSSFAIAASVENQIVFSNNRSGCWCISQAWYRRLFDFGELHLGLGGDAALRSQHIPRSVPASPLESVGFGLKFHRSSVKRDSISVSVRFSGRVAETAKPTKVMSTCKIVKLNFNSSSSGSWVL